MKKILISVLIVIFLLIITLTTHSLYSLLAKDHKVLIPANIITGKSQAPNQYRILGPVLYSILNTSLIHNPNKSDQIIIFLSILLAYLSAGALFYKSTNSLPLTLLGVLAMLGCFSFGMIWKYRQEFFEVAFVSGALLSIISIRKAKVLYLLLIILTWLGSLNKETYIFCITAIVVYVVWQRIILNKEPFVEHVIGMIALVGVFIISYAGPRFYYGLSNYHCTFWTYKQNIGNLMDWSSPYHIGHIGAGLLFIYLITFVLGNRWYFFFIIGYAIPMLFVATFISDFSEHRVFYPLMTLMLASILGFSSTKEISEQNILPFSKHY